MENNQNFGIFFKNRTLIIPDYQRAYSWDEKQLIPFVTDLVEHCDNDYNPDNDPSYYLGHYILENSKDGSPFEIVDGQQRITTIYLFLLVCDYLQTNNDYLEDVDFKPVSYDGDNFLKIVKILKHGNDIKSGLDDLYANCDTLSAKRMVDAVKFFFACFQNEGESKKKSAFLNISDIPKYVKILLNAYCSFAIYKDKAVASQIFELHNTRGLKLTETEKVKALLMKTIFLNTENKEEQIHNIKDIQDDFSKIYKLEETASEKWLRGDLPLDSILMYHLRAVDDGEKIKDFWLPQSMEGDQGSLEYIKNKILEKQGDKVILLQYVKDVAREFRKSMEIITKTIPDNDEKNSLVGDVLLLDKNRSLIFLLRACRINEDLDEKLIERWENFLLRYEIIYWAGFFSKKRYRGDFDKLFAALNKNENFNKCFELLENYYKGTWFGADWEHLGESSKRLFESSKNQWLQFAYFWNKKAYILYKFEINNGGDRGAIRKEIFKDDNVSIDHIVAQSLSWVDLGFTNYPQQKEEADKLWEEILTVINGIGNLSLSTTSNNASDSNGLPKDHVETYKNAGLKNTAEIVNFWDEPKEFVKKINNRSDLIIDYVYDKVINNESIWE